MPSSQFTITDFDRDIFNDELQDFVPAKVFDAHCHIWDESSAMPDTPPSGLRYNYSAKDVAAYTSKIFPGRQLGFLFLPSPVVGENFENDLDWCGSQVGAVPASASAVTVYPAMKQEKLAAAIEKYHFQALKPYLLFSTGIPYDSCIHEFMPESLVEVANNYHMTIVLHMSKVRCASDPENLTELKYFTEKYPCVTWQLAHCARNFHGCFMERSIHVLKHLDHIIYDLSAVCDDYSFYLLFKHEDKGRLLYGSDNVAAGGVHGTYSPYGRTWGLYPQEPDLTKTTLIAYESLRCLRQGALMAEITQPELEDIFYNNAARHYLKNS